MDNIRELYMKVLAILKSDDGYYKPPKDKVPYKYIVASVFPDKETMDIALSVVKKPPTGST